jgi:hypothetical protein
MHYKSPMNKAVGQQLTLTDRLIALSVLLCFGSLMGASGPHLVHHLDARHPGLPHPLTHTSQPTDCLVLSLLQHIPLAGHSFASLWVFLSTMEPVTCAHRLQAVTTPRPINQARSPPCIFPS